MSWNGFQQEIIGRFQRQPSYKAIAAIWKFGNKLTSVGIQAIVWVQTLKLREQHICIVNFSNSLVLKHAKKISPSHPPFLEKPACGVNIKLHNNRREELNRWVPQNVKVALGVDNQWVNGGKVGISIDRWHEIGKFAYACLRVGNTSAVIGKDLVIGSAVLVSSALFGAFVSCASVSAIDMFTPKVFIGLIVGTIKDSLHLSAALIGMHLSITGIIDENCLPQAFDRFGPFARVKMKWFKIEKRRWQQRYCAISTFINRAERQAATNEMQGVVVYENELLFTIGKAGDPDTMNADMAIGVNTRGTFGEGMIAAINFHVHFISQVRNFTGDIMSPRQLDTGSNGDESFASSLLREFKGDKTKSLEPAGIKIHVELHGVTALDNPGKFPCVWQVQFAAFLHSWGQECSEGEGIVTTISGLKGN